MIRHLITILFLVGFFADVCASDSTTTKPKKFFIDINGGMTSMLLKGPRQPYVKSGPNNDYDLRGGYTLHGNFFYQPRSDDAVMGFNFFCGIGFGINKMSFTENLNYTNSSTSKFQKFSYSPGAIKTTIINEQISFCVGFRKTMPRINVSHKLGCFYSFASEGSFTNFYTKHESGSYYNGSMWVSYTNDKLVRDNFTFKESICPYYGFDFGLGNKMLQPHLGFEAIYFTNDIVLYSSESNLPILAFGHAIMIKVYLGLTIGF